MSLAIHVFMVEEFSEDSYRRFLDNAQNLFGKWNLEESLPFNMDPRCLTIHECWIESEHLSPDESFRVNVAAHKHVKDVFVWDFDYEWHLRLETGAGRSPLGLAVQLGAWLMAIHRFRFTFALDRDTGLKDEPTEFRSLEASAEHTKRLLEDFELSPALKRRGIVTHDGRLNLPLWI